MVNQNIDVLWDVAP